MILQIGIFSIVMTVEFVENHSETEVTFADVTIVRTMFINFAGLYG